eukprot:comp20165_c0_seq1/m.24969 comp20165_c0_seq1/g.24969  ORF comp20165_c0_seq1/g.24969 comp20165_c0_seq1/m.24969 type:complete len:625 (-) comp20165_c0_seq1:596-2470(-)
MWGAKALGLTVALCTHQATAYLPGVAPRGYDQGEKIEVYANELNSRLSVIAHEYYYYDFCKATGDIKEETLNLGQRLFGDRLQQTAYEVMFGEEKQCTEVCTKTYSGDNADDVTKMQALVDAIKEQYMHHWVIDNMDVVMKYAHGKELSQKFMAFPVGSEPQGGEADKLALFNHVNITVLYHSPEGLLNMDQNKNMIVGAEIGLASRVSCKDTNVLFIKPLGKGEKQTVTYTYEVHFVRSPLPWASRWDPYLEIEHADIRWLSIANSLIIVVFLSGMVGMILLRTVYKDIAHYNREVTSEEEQMEETGWKLVHADVFRPPQHSLLLSALVGSGIQILGMIFITLAFSFLHLLSPMRRGSIVTAAVVWFVCLGALAGYSSARLDKMFGGSRWKSTVAATALLVPGCIFVLFIILNTVLWAEGSASHVEFVPMLSLMALWFLVSLPLTFFGAYLAYKKPAIEAPVRVNQIPREIPDQAVYMRPIPSVLIGGILPFGAIFIELFFLLNSLWNHKLYFLPFFLFLVFVILLVSCAEVTILLCYFQLCAEDYHWWWRSYLRGASAAFYLFLYSIFYFCTAISFRKSASTFLYFGFTLMITIGFAVMTGCVGFLSSVYFVRKIYSSVKID